MHASCNEQMCGEETPQEITGAARSASSILPRLHSVTAMREKQKGKHWAQRRGCWRRTWHALKKAHVEAQPASTHAHVSRKLDARSGNRAHSSHSTVCGTASASLSVGRVGQSVGRSSWAMRTVPSICAAGETGPVTGVSAALGSALGNASGTRRTRTNGRATWVCHSWGDLRTAEQAKRVSGAFTTRVVGRRRLTEVVQRLAAAERMPYAIRKGRSASATARVDGARRRATHILVFWP